MTDTSSPNSKTNGHRQPPLDRLQHETLYDFLYRRDDAMNAELVTMRARLVDQEFDFEDERRTWRRRMKALIWGEALIATGSAILCWLSFPGNLPSLFLIPGLTALLGGICIARCAPMLERAYSTLWLRRRW